MKAYLKLDPIYKDYIAATLRTDEYLNELTYNKEKQVWYIDIDYPGEGMLGDFIKMRKITTVNVIQL